jgi:general secretion pathway protein D
MIRGQQKDTQPPPSVVMPINEAPVLPPMRAPAASEAKPPVTAP